MGWLKRVLFCSFVIGGLVMGGCRPPFGSAWDSWVIPPNLPPEISNTLNDLRNIAKEETSQTFFSPDYIIYKDTQKIYAIPSQESGLPYLEDTDDDALINRAIVEIYNNKNNLAVNGIIFLKGGSYYIDDTIRLKINSSDIANISIIGSPVNYSQLIWVGNSSVNMIEMGEGVLKNLYIKVNASENTVSQAISCFMNSSLVTIKLENIIIDMQNVGDGISFDADTDQSGDFILKNVKIFNPKTFSFDVNLSYRQNVYFQDCYFEDDCIFSIGDFNESICSIKNSRMSKIKIAETTTSSGRKLYLNFENCFFPTDFISFNNYEGKLYINFSRCFFHGTTDFHTIDLTGVIAYLNFVDCFFDNLSNYGIKFDNSLSQMSIIRIKNCFNFSDENNPVYRDVGRFAPYSNSYAGNGVIIYDDKFAFSRYITDGSTGTFDLCRLPAGTKVKRVVTFCEETFDGSITIDIGISSDTDGFLPNSSIGKNEGDFSGGEDDELGALLWDGTNSHKREYINGDEYVIQATVGTNDASSGSLAVLIEFDKLYK